MSGLGPDIQFHLEDVLMEVRPEDPDNDETVTNLMAWFPLGTEQPTSTKLCTTKHHWRVLSHSLSSPTLGLAALMFANSVVELADQVLLLSGDA